MSPEANKYILSATAKLGKTIKEVAELNFDKAAAIGDYQKAANLAEFLSNPNFENDLIAAGLKAQIEINNFLEKYSSNNSDIPFEFEEVEEVEYDEEPLITTDPHLYDTSDNTPIPFETSTVEPHPAPVEIDYERFPNWKDFFGDFDLEAHPTIETDLRNTLVTIVKKFPETYKRFQSEGRTDYLGVIHELYLMDINTLNQVFNKDDNRTLNSTARVLTMVHRLMGNNLIAPENFIELAENIREKSPDNNTYVVTIIEELIKSNNEDTTTPIDGSNSDDPTNNNTGEENNGTLDESPKGEDSETIEKTNKNIDLIVETINYLKLRAEAEHMNDVPWPVVSSVVTKLTNLNDRFIDELDINEIVCPTGAEIRNGHVTYNELDVVKLVIFQKSERLHNLPRSDVKRYFKSINQAYSLAKEKMADLEN